MEDDMFIACRKTGHLCNTLYKKKDARCKRCLKQISEGIIDGKKKEETLEKNCIDSRPSNGTETK